MTREISYEGVSRVRGIADIFGYASCQCVSLEDAPRWSGDSMTSPPKFLAFWAMTELAMAAAQHGPVLTRGRLGGAVGFPRRYG